MILSSKKITYISSFQKSNLLLRLTALPTLISRLRLLLRPSLHSLPLIPLRHIVARRCSPQRRRQANVSCNRERKNKGKRRGREERAQDIALDGETSLPIQARSKVTTATNSAVHAHRSQAPSSAIAALAVAHSAQAQWRSPMLTPSSQTGRTLAESLPPEIR